MIVIDYKKQYHKKIIHACVLALKQGKVLAYPTDTSYGLAVDATNIKAIKKLYKIKGRDFNKPVHIIPPTPVFSKKVVEFGVVASKLAKKFFPGPLTLVLPFKSKNINFKILSAGSGWLGLRLPKNLVALDLAHMLGRPITTTSSNISGKPDCYSAKDVVEQFVNSKIKPDIIIDAGKLTKRKPSTVVKIVNEQVEILRQGPISQKQITNALK